MAKLIKDACFMEASFLTIVQYYSSGRSRGGSGGLSEPPFETKLFYFHGEFSEKSGKINKYSGKINKSNPRCKFEPCGKKSWVRPCIHAAIRSLSNHAPYWFLSPLALQFKRPVHCIPSDDTVTE